MTKQPLLPDPARFYQALRRLVRQEVTPLLDQLERDNMPVRWQGAWVSGRRCRRGDLVKLGANVWIALRETTATPATDSTGDWEIFAAAPSPSVTAPPRGDVLAADIQRLGRELTELRADMATIKGAGA